ncbi:MAG: hypothetical protein AUG74_07510 [Bacteroidetes bacterium 13_1_20CM_4_60_6]|nr:MAG: hypothetical protein AUG74_07510 [Bacteroidetes bacterium 13_1_20CM_4_60_6]
MLSLEEELATTGADAAALAAERRDVFSLFGELRTASYIAVALVTTGAGIWIKNNADRLGPVAILTALLVAAAACYAFALMGAHRAPLPDAADATRPPRTIVADYVLLLGALLLSAAVGYAESQFHLLGPNWSRHLAFLALLHIATAYLTDSRLLLSAGLAALAGWFGAELRTFDNDASFGGRALACAATVAVFRAANRHKAFDATYEHFAANVAFFGALAWAFDAQMRWIGVLIALALAALVVWRGLRGGGEAMVIYAIVYATIAFDTAILTLVSDTALKALYLLFSTPVAIVVLFVVYRRLKERRG